jgi:hypothetical protein
LSSLPPPSNSSFVLHLILDLDSAGISEECVASSLCTLAPTKLLWLYSSGKQHIALHLDPAAVSNVANLRGAAPARAVDVSPGEPDSLPLLASPDLGTRTLPTYPSVRKVLRRPFKSRAFLHTLLSLLQETWPGGRAGEGGGAASAPTPADDSSGVHAAAACPSATHPVAMLPPTKAAAAPAASVDATAPSSSMGASMQAQLQPTQSNARPPRISNMSGAYPLRILVSC